MIDIMGILTLATASFIGGAVGGVAASLLMDKIEIQRMANLFKRVARLEGYYGGEVSKDNRAEQDTLENQLLSAAMNILADKSMDGELKKQKIMEIVKMGAQTRPDLVKKIATKFLKGEF